PDAGDLVIGIEDLALVELQALDDVLVRVRVERLFERLAQKVLAALRSRDVPIRSQNDVVGGERVRRDEESEVAPHDAPLVLGQPVGILPQGDVAAHVYFWRHPVVRAPREIFLPGPLVLERHQLIDVGLRIDDALVLHPHAPVAVAGRIALLRRARGSGRRRHQSAHRLQVQAGDRLGADLVKRKHLFPPRCSAHWHAPLSGWSIWEIWPWGAAAPRWATAAATAGTPPSAGTAFSWPAFTVDFSACVAPIARR